MRYRLRTLLIVLAMTAGLAVCVLVLVAVTMPSEGSIYQSAHFTQMPDDDAKLIEWLRSQPGVHEAWVDRNADGSIGVGWSYCGSILRPSPAGEMSIQEGFDRFGYHDRPPIDYDK